MGTGTSCCQGPAVAYPAVSRKTSARRLQRQLSQPRLTPVSPTTTHTRDTAHEMSGIRVEQPVTGTTPPASTFLPLRQINSVQPSFNPFRLLPPLSPVLPRSPRVVPARDPNSSATDLPPFSASGSRSNRSASRRSSFDVQEHRTYQLSSTTENLRMMRSGLSHDAVDGGSAMSPMFNALRHSGSRSQSSRPDATPSLQTSFTEQQKQRQLDESVGSV
jgi:hypothetical protein